MKKVTLLAILVWLFSIYSQAQIVNEDELGIWNMYFFNKKFENSRFGIQGDYQFRFWNVGADLEQVLLRTGLTYKPKSTDVLLTLGYANITTGEFGESDRTVNENRIYQEALLNQKVGNRIYLTHRFRYEQRFNEGQDFRTRYRYNIFVNVPFNKEKLEKDAVYLALYNEFFINGERSIGDGRSVQYFDRNRTYAGLGFGLRDNLRLQLGIMRQTTANWSKEQGQLSLHHKF